MNPKLNEKCLQVEFENGDIDIAELDKAFKDDDTNYVGSFKNAPDVRVFASVPYRELGFNLIHVSLRFKEKSKKFFLNCQLILHFFRIFNDPNFSY